jgi:hypothetical protein
VAEANGFSGFDFSNYVFLEAVPGTDGRAQAFVLYMPDEGEQNTSSEPGGMVPLLIGLGLLGTYKAGAIGGTTASLSAALHS